MNARTRALAVPKQASGWLYVGLLALGFAGSLRPEPPAPPQPRLLHHAHLGLGSVVSGDRGAGGTGLPVAVDRPQDGHHRGGPGLAQRREPLDARAQPPRCHAGSRRRLAHVCFRHHPVRRAGRRRGPCIPGRACAKSGDRHPLCPSPGGGQQPVLLPSERRPPVPERSS